MGRWVRGAERAFDALFGVRANPLRQLGALAFWMFWIVVASGAYVYIFYETSVAGAWRSVEDLTQAQPWAGGLMRSLHRYASDGFVVVSLVHLAREWMLGRFNGFRWFSWLSGVPLLWLAVISGLIGYWMVWDQRALYIGVASFEWLAGLPGVGSETVRNFVSAQALTDRFFSLLSFLHIGVPLLLLLGLWAHLLRITRPQTMPVPALTWGSLGMLLVLAIAWPALSMPVADLQRMPAAVEIDWFYLAALPLADFAPLATGLLLIVATALLALLPWIARRAPVQAAVVDPAHCNGCTQCFADCPYGAITMAPHANGRRYAQMAVVAADLCAGCGICAGACPSATPFRRGAPFATGIDLPQLPLATLRARLDAAIDGLARRPDAPAAPVLVLGCDRGAPIDTSLEGAAMLSAPCSGLWPPVFIEYALRRGAAGVLVTGCPIGDCEFRQGSLWTEQRIAGQRMPTLRARVDARRVRVHWALREDAQALARAVQAFRAELAHLPGAGLTAEQAHA